MATHDSDVVDAMRRRVIELDDGRVVRDQPRGVYGSPYIRAAARLEAR